MESSDNKNKEDRNTTRKVCDVFKSAHHFHLTIVPFQRSTKYPIEDLDVAGTVRNIDHSKPILRPKLNKQLQVPKEAFELFLMTWSFINGFG